MWDAVVHVVAAATLVALVYCSFENGYQNDFTFDDHLAIEGNGDVDINNQPFRHLWFSDIWGKDLLAHDSHRSYRPLLIVIFRWLYTQSKEAPLFRLVSISAHGVTTILVYGWALTLLKPSVGSRWDRRLVAWATAALFASHPIHVEAVTAVVNLAEPASAFCILLGYLCFHSSLLSSRRGGALWHALCSSAWWIAAVLAALLKETGILVALMPIVYVLGRWTVTACGRLCGGRAAASASGALSTRLSLWWLLHSTAYLYLYFAMRSLLVNPQRETLLASPALLAQFVAQFLWRREGDSYLNASQLLRRAENPFAFLTDRATKVYSMLYLYFRYVYLLLWPREQSPEYSYDCIPAVGDPADVRFVNAVATIGAIVALGVYSCALLLRPPPAANAPCPPVAAGAAETSDTDAGSAAAASATATTAASVAAPASASAPAATPTTTTTRAPTSSRDMATPADAASADSALFEGLVWLVIPFAPLTGVVFTLGTLLAERLLYLCSVGFCFVLALLLFRLAATAASAAAGRRQATRWVTRGVFLAAIAGLVAWYTTQTRAYNVVWQDDAHLFLHAVAVCPRSAKSHLQVSKLFSNAGYLDEAWRHLQQAKAIDAAFCDVHLQEAFILLGRNATATLPPDAPSPAAHIKATYRRSASASASASSPLALDVGAGDFMTRVAQAIRALQRSIGCVYTNHQALRMLTQLWDLQQMAATPQIAAYVGVPHAVYRAQLLRRQARQAAAIGLDVVAVHKFVDAATALFDHAAASSTPAARRHEAKALHVLAQARRVLRRYFDVDAPRGRPRDGAGDDAAAATVDEAQWQLLTGLRCRAATLSGAMRSTWMEQQRAAVDRAANATLAPAATALRRQWQAGALRVAHDLATAATDAHCVVHALATDAGGWEQLRVGAAHTAKWLQELEQQRAAATLVAIASDTSDASDDDAIDGIAPVYRSDFARLFDRSQVFAQRRSDDRAAAAGRVATLPTWRAALPYEVDSVVPLAAAYARAVQLATLTQDDVAAQATRFRVFAQQLRATDDATAAVAAAVATDAADAAMAPATLVALLQSEQAARRQTARLLTLAVQRHYLHRRFHLAAYYGGLFLLQELLAVVAWTPASEAPAVGGAGAAAAYVAGLLREYRARSLRLWHAQGELDRVAEVERHRLQWQRAAVDDNDHAAAATAAAATTATLTPLFATPLAPAAAANATYAVGLPSELGRRHHEAHHVALWRHALPLRELLRVLQTPTHTAALLATTASDASDASDASGGWLHGDRLHVRLAEMRQLLDDATFCTNLFWYTDALAGVSGLYDAPDYAAGVADLLQLYRLCALRHPSTLPTEAEAPSVHATKATKKKATKKAKQTARGGPQFTRLFASLPEASLLRTVEGYVEAQLQPLLRREYDVIADTSAATLAEGGVAAAHATRMARMTRILPVAVVDKTVAEFRAVACQLGSRVPGICASSSAQQPGDVSQSARNDAL